MSKVSAVVTILAIALFGLAKLNLGFGVEDGSFLIRGLGLIDSDESYSSRGRWDIAMQTLRIYQEHPLIGVSLGGIAPAIARQNYATANDNDDAKANEGMCTTIEVLAASGTIGFCFFLLYIARLLRAAWHFGAASPVVKAFAWAFIFLLLILQVDQNILRTYVWFHIGLLSVACRVALQSVGKTSLQSSEVLFQTEP